jgi:iron complex transport system ATP-binding protein
MILRINSLSFSHELQSHNVIREVSWAISKPVFTAVMGPNGSGKTTLLKIIAGILHNRHTDLAVQIFDRTLGELRATPASMAKMVSYVPGYLEPTFDITVYDFVMQGRFTYAEYMKSYSKDDHSVVEACLEQTGLVEMNHMLVRHLSSGERQLALIARGLAQQPEILLVDETISNLDLHYQIRALGALSEYHNAGKTVLMVSHDLNLTSEFCPEVVWLKHGEIISQGPIEICFNQLVLSQLYPGSKISVGVNPYTKKPKVFYKPV